jgi:hypothetical protein
MNTSPSKDHADLFWPASAKTREELTPNEFRAVVACFGWLDNDERKKFAIKRADLLPHEIQNYSELKLLESYFPE